MWAMLKTFSGWEKALFDRAGRWAAASSIVCGLMVSSARRREQVGLFSDEAPELQRRSLGVLVPGSLICEAGRGDAYAHPVAESREVVPHGKGQTIDPFGSIG